MISYNESDKTELPSLECDKPFQHINCHTGQWFNLFNECKSVAVNILNYIPMVAI